MGGYAILIMALLVVGCKSIGNQSDQNLLSATVEEEEESELVLVCTVTDEDLPKYEIEIFKTGFNVQQGTDVDVVIHKFNSTSQEPDEETTQDGQAALGEKAVEIVFEKGRIVATRPPDQEPQEDSAYLGSLELKEPKLNRWVTCL